MRPNDGPVPDAARGGGSGNGAPRGLSKTIAREAAWRSSQASRLEADRDRLRESVRQIAAAADAADAGGRNAAAGPRSTGCRGRRMPRRAVGRPASAISEWEARAASLRARRDQLAAEEAAIEAARREAEFAERRAAAAANLDQERIASLERQTTELAPREQRIGAEREGLGEELAARGTARGRSPDGARRIAGRQRPSAGSSDRGRSGGYALSRSPPNLPGARPQAEVAELEARLALDAIREQVARRTGRSRRPGPPSPDRRNRWRPGSGTSATHRRRTGRRRPPRRRADARRRPRRDALGHSLENPRCGSHVSLGCRAGRRTAGACTNSRRCDGVSTSSARRTRSPSRSTTPSRHGWTVSRPSDRT